MLKCVRIKIYSDSGRIKKAEKLFFCCYMVLDIAINHSFILQVIVLLQKSWDQPKIFLFPNQSCRHFLFFPLTEFDIFTRNVSTEVRKG